MNLEICGKLISILETNITLVTSRPDVKQIPVLLTTQQFFAVAKMLLERARDTNKDDPRAANIAYITAYMVLEEYTLVWPLTVQEAYKSITPTMIEFHKDVVKTIPLFSTFFPTLGEPATPPRWQECFTAFKEKVLGSSKLTPKHVRPTSHAAAAAAEDMAKPGPRERLSSFMTRSPIRNKSPKHFKYRPDLPSSAHHVADSTIKNFLEFAAAEGNFHDIYHHLILMIKPFLINPQAGEKAKAARFFKRRTVDKTTEEFVQYLLLLYFQLLHFTGIEGSSPASKYKMMLRANEGKAVPMATIKLSAHATANAENSSIYMNDEAALLAKDAAAAAGKMFTDFSLCPPTGIDEANRVVYANPQTDAAKLAGQAKDNQVDGFDGVIIYA